MVKNRTVGRASTAVGGFRGLQSGPGGAYVAGGKGGNGMNEVKGGFDGPIVAPWRKTVSIFKQPVTLVRTTSRDTKPAPTNELQAPSRGRQDKPKQVFWAKRLERLRAMMPVTPDQMIEYGEERRQRRAAEEAEKRDEENEAAEIEAAKKANGKNDDLNDGKNSQTPMETGDDHPTGSKNHNDNNSKSNNEAAAADDEEDDDDDDEEYAAIPESLALPSRILGVGPDIEESVAAASLASALQTPSATGAPHQPPITGQTNPKKHLDSNPAVFTNPDQPLIHAVVVSDQDVAGQEQRVLDARKRLEEAIKHFGS